MIGISDKKFLKDYSSAVIQGHAAIFAGAGFSSCVFSCGSVRGKVRRRFHGFCFANVQNTETTSSKSRAKTSCGGMCHGAK